MMEEGILQRLKILSSLVFYCFVCNKTKDKQETNKNAQTTFWRKKNVYKKKNIEKRIKIKRHKK